MPQEPRRNRHRQRVHWLAVAAIALLGAGARAGAHDLDAGFVQIDLQSAFGPGDILIHRVGDQRFAVVSHRDQNLVSVHALGEDGTFGEKTGEATVGTRPLGLASLRNGQFFGVVNSGSNDVSILALNVKAGPVEINRVPSGGAAPFAIAAAYDDQFLVANRDSDTLCSFSVAGNGEVDHLDSAATGIDPHIVSVGGQALVVVGNSTSHDLSVYHLSSTGELAPLGRQGLDTFGNAEAFFAPSPANRHGYQQLIQPLLAQPFFPRAMTFDPSGDTLFVAAGSTTPGIEDRILVYREIQEQFQLESVAYGGFFATDFWANEREVFLATINRSGQNELRGYWHRGGALRPASRIAWPGTLSFKAIAGTSMAAPHAAGAAALIVSEFQGGNLRSIRVEGAFAP